MLTYNLLTIPGHLPKIRDSTARGKARPEQNESEIVTKVQSYLENWKHERCKIKVVWCVGCPVFLTQKEANA